MERKEKAKGWGGNEKQFIRILQGQFSVILFHVVELQINLRIIREQTKMGKGQFKK